MSLGMSDIVYGALLLALSAIFFIATFNFPKLTIALSPTVFPRFVTVSLFILSSILMIQGLRKRLASHGEAAPSQPAVTLPKRSFVIRFLLLAACALLYALLLEPAGFILLTPPFIAGAMLIFGDRKWYRIVLVSLLSTVVLYVVFRMIFRVPLPRSPLY
jgi:putative tricarboxylic transport membrane protein